jgi:hypothetical protein
MDYYSDVDTMAFLIVIVTVATHRLSVGHSGALAKSRWTRNGDMCILLQLSPHVHLSID